MSIALGLFDWRKEERMAARNGGYSAAVTCYPPSYFGQNNPYTSSTYNVRYKQAGISHCGYIVTVLL